MRRRVVVAAAAVAGGLVVGDQTPLPSPPTVVAAPSYDGLTRPVGTHRTSRSDRRHPLQAASRRTLRPKARRHPASTRGTSHDLRGPQRWLTVTAYCSTGNRNAAGDWPTVGTAAGNAWALGTRLHVAGYGDVTVADRSAPGATDVDLFLGADSGCAARAVAWGRRRLAVTVLP